MASLLDIGKNLKNRANPIIQGILDSTDLDERASQYFRPKTGTLATQGRQVIQSIARRPIPQQLQSTNRAMGSILQSRNPLIAAPRGIARGTLRGGTFGFVRTPQFTQPTRAENAGDLVGSLVGSMASFGKITKPLEGIGKAGLAASRLRNVGLAQKAIPALTRELGQSAAWVGGSKLGGEKVNFKKDLATGLGMSAIGGVRGIKGFGKGMDQGRTTKIEWDPEDSAILDRLRGALKNKKIEDDELENIDSWMKILADGYLKKTEIDRIAGKWGSNRRKMLEEIGEVMFKRSKDAPQLRESGYVDDMMMGITGKKPQSTVGGVIPQNQKITAKTKLQLTPESTTSKIQSEMNPKVSESSEDILSPNFYIGEPTAKTQAKVAQRQTLADQKTESQNYKEWQKAVFSQNKTRTMNQAINDLEKAMRTNTNKSVNLRLKKEAAQALDTARKTYVINKKGKVIVGKAGKPMAKEILANSINWKDKARLSYVRETMERNFEEVMGKDAPAMIERFIAPVKKAEAERIRFLNKERTSIRNLGISPGSNESKLLQQFGEKKLTLAQLQQATPEWQKVVNAEKIMRQKYDTYLNQINSALTRNGYDPIPRRKDYFLHFQEIGSALEKFGIPVKDDKLPTDINGLTADFRPGKNFFSSALPRLGDKAEMDAITGIDKYIEGASKQIYHTDNIQNLRLLDKALREVYAGGDHLSNFVAELTEYTNQIAGKKAMMDRAAEALVGRKIYGAADALRKQTGSNMVGMNVASAMTNYIPLTQAAASTSKPAFLKALFQSMTAPIKDDGFVNKSDFLTRRMGSDRLAISNWGKAQNAGYWLMKTVDNFSSQAIVRGKYNEGIAKGLDPSRAMKQADDFASRVMADRSLGSMPTLFNTKTLSALTQFQLEVNNQLSYLFKDIPRNNSKAGAASALGQVFIYSFIFNEMFEKLTGRRPAFDPIGIAVQTYEDYTDEDMKKGQATKNLIKNVGDTLPFSSMLTGGRIPIGSAIPNPIAIAQGESTLKKELKKPLYYILPPTAGGQIKKAVEGLDAYRQEGSYTDSGRLRYPIEQTPGNLAKMAAFGQYSTPEARDYFRKGQTPLGDKQTATYRGESGGMDYFKSILQNRKDENTLDELKAQGNEFEYNSKLYYQKDDEWKSIDLDRIQNIPTYPTLTGDANLDKEAVSRYKSTLSSITNDVYDLWEMGKLTTEEASALLDNVQTAYSQTKKAKKPKKISIKKSKSTPYKLAKSKKIKFSQKKLPKPKIVKTKGYKILTYTDKTPTVKRNKPVVRWS